MLFVDLLSYILPVVIIGWILLFAYAHCGE